MAARPIETASPNVVDQVVLIRISEIETSNRLRPVDPVWAAALGKVMSKESQRTPVEVCRLPGRAGYALVVGAHRLEGLRLEGHEYVRAIVVTNDTADRRSREVSENIWRKDLSPVDRAAFVAELVMLQKVAKGIDPSVDGRVASAAVRWQKELKADAADANVTMTVAYGWADEVADRLGFSRSVVERDLLLHRRLLPRSIDLLRKHDHPVLKNASQLRALAKLDGGPQGEQMKVVELLCWSGLSYGGRPVPKTVAEAIAAVRNVPKAAPTDKNLSAFLGAFSRMSAAERAGALDQLAGMYQPLFVTAVGRMPAAGKRSAMAQMGEVVRPLEQAVNDALDVIDGPVAERLRDAMWATAA